MACGLFASCVLEKFTEIEVVFVKCVFGIYRIICV